MVHLACDRAGAGFGVDSIVTTGERILTDETFLTEIIDGWEPPFRDAG